MKTFTLFLSGSKTYIGFAILSAYFAANAVDLYHSLMMFIIATSLDTLTSIHAGAISKGLKFNPFKKYFWCEIQSGLIRIWLRKVFLEYAVYLLIALALDILIIQQQLAFQVLEFRINLPIFVIWVFIAVEIWSVGENIEKTGKTNWIKRFINAFEGYIPEKFKKLFKKSTSDEKSI